MSCDSYMMSKIIKCIKQALGLIKLKANENNMKKKAKTLLSIDDLPKHLSVIPELDFSQDLLIDPLSQPWFRLGAWTIDSSIKLNNVADVISRQSILIDQGAFETLFDSLDAVGNVLSGLGKSGGSIRNDKNGREYRYE